MSAEISVGVIPQVGVDRRVPDRPFSNLSPVDSVVQKLTVPGAFSAQEQILVLKAHNLREAEIAEKIGVSIGTVNHSVARARHEFGSYIGAVVALEGLGRIPQELLTGEFVFDNYRLNLTSKEKDMLDFISRTDMWEAESSEIAAELGITEPAIKNRLLRIYRKLGVNSRIQAVIYNLYIPEQKRRPNAERLVESAKKMWEIEDVPHPPDELLQVLERSREQGFSFEPIYLPPKVFVAKSQFPGRGVSPQTSIFYRHRFSSEILTKRFKKDVAKEVQCWELIREGQLPSDTATLSGNWVLVEGIQRPNYEEGRQMYIDDFLVSHIESLRKQDLVVTPDWFKNIPAGSRFGLSGDEIKTLIVPYVASKLGVNAQQVGLPRAIEFNVIGNIAHPEWGSIDTLERFSDICVGRYNLIGGYNDLESYGVFFGISPYDGLGNIEINEIDSRDDDIGFRLMINFPQQQAA